MTIRIHPFYAFNQCRLALCPGPNKHPVVAGYPDLETTITDIQPRLDAGEAERFCWLLDHNHLIIDVDLHCKDRNGLESLRELSRELQVDLRATCRAVVRTPTGGLHLCWLMPPELQILAIDRTKYPGLDTLSRAIRNNALVIGVGSTHPTAAGRYGWETEVPVLEMAPEPLLQLLERKQRVHVPRQAPEVEQERNSGRGVTPVSDFMTSWEGVRLLGLELSKLGYEFLLTSEEFEGAEQPFYEYRRAGKTTGSRISGYLGKRSREGNFLLTNFSHSDEYFEPGDTITIAEAICRVWNGGKGFEGEGGQDRSRALIGELKGSGFGVLSVEEMFGTIAVPPLSDVEGEAEWPHLIRNFEPGPKSALPIGMWEVLKQIEYAGLRCCGGTLFAREKKRIVVLDRVDALFGYMKAKTTVDWRGSHGGFVSRGEFYETLRQVCPQYTRISAAPHFPPIPGVYYLNSVPEGRGKIKDLYDFVDHFRPESELDRLLMVAAIVTPFWGGPMGERPLFTVTSPDGQGAGKSTFCHAIARLTGMGRFLSHQIRSPRQFEELPKKMGSMNALSADAARTITVDNFRGAQLGGSDIESMITERELAVWKLYCGEVQVPNLYTWFVTGNFVDMSEDLAQRTVEIRILKPSAYSSEWSEKLDDWDLQKVIDGISMFFAYDPGPLSECTRFATWSRQVLGRLERPEELVRLIELRSKELSTADDDAHDLLIAIKAYVANLLKDPTSRRVDGKLLIQATPLCKHLNFIGEKAPNGKPWNTRWLGRLMKEHLTRIPELKPYRDAHARGYLWTASETFQDDGPEVT